MSGKRIQIIDHPAGSDSDKSSGFVLPTAMHSIAGNHGVRMRENGAWLLI